MTEKYGQISLGSLNYAARTAQLLSGNCFLVEISFSNFSPGFACLQQTFHLSRFDFAPIFFTGDLTEVECTMTFR